MGEAFRQRGILSDNNRGKEMKYIVWHQRETRHIKPLLQNHEPAPQLGHNGVAIKEQILLAKTLYSFTHSSMVNKTNYWE